MILLALDTCDARGSVAVLHDGEPAHVVAHDTSEDYSVWLLPAISRVLAASDATFESIDTYVVATGPGSFTGVRIGLTTVKAWAEVTGKPIVGVSRLEALATLAAGSQPYVAAFMNGQRQQIFGALYQRQGSTIEPAGEEAVISPQNFLAASLQMSGGQGIDWISPDSQMVLDTEDWREHQALGESIQLASPILAPALGRLGFRWAQEKRFTDPLALDANYVRRSDAELFWKDGPSRQQSDAAKHAK
jgi:tRNA threonylcarbamoyladenosine biosynthesis protein TsaB